MEANCGNCLFWKAVAEEREACAVAAECALAGMGDPDSEYVEEPRENFMGVAGEAIRERGQS
jgi:hypothetical protein